MHRRRVEVRRQEGHRRLRVLVGISAVTLVAGGGWAATNSRALDVDHIEVQGTLHTPVTQAVAAAQIHRGERMLDLDLGAAARSVRTLPWVATAAVDRQWPGTVRIRLVERVPAAVIPVDGHGALLVDPTGRYLDQVETAPDDLPVLAGVPAGPPGSLLSVDGAAALSVALALPPELRSRVIGVSPVGGATGEVQLQLPNEATVRLGPPEDLQRKFDAVRAVLAQVDMRNLAVLDVRRPDSPVLTRRDAPAKVSTPRAG